MTGRARRTPLALGVLLGLGLTFGCGTPVDFSLPPAGDVDGGGGQLGEGDVPENDYCGPVSSWLQDSIRFEQRVLVLVNQRRATGASCGSEGVFAPAGALTMNDALRCAARRHSLDMAQRGFFDHDNPDGETAEDRIERAEYTWGAWGENIAAGQPTAEVVVQAWMDSDGHCANIMNPNFTEIGVGHHVSDNWTQVFGKPR